MSLQSYSRRQKTIFFWFMFSYTIMLNLLIFGKQAFKYNVFLQTFLFSFLYCVLIYFIFQAVANIVQRRYPDDSMLFNRLIMMLSVMYVLNILLIQILYLLYELISIQNVPPRRYMEWWVTGFSCFVSTIVAFANEATTGWDNWKNSIIETEQIKNAYQKTRLLGLKGQVNPHFLFNCFNSLSSLISEDSAKAEKFLDEMTKVHRYMLRSDDEQLTSLKEEVSFANSYLYLIKERFGEAVQATINVHPQHLQLLLPPLSMQVILENIIYNNAVNKTSPLVIKIESEDGYLVVMHSLHLKTRGSGAVEDEEGLDNLVKKYELLNREKVWITEEDKSRCIVLPLIHLKKEVEL